MHMTRGGAECQTREKMRNERQVEIVGQAKKGRQNAQKSSLPHPQTAANTFQIVKQQLQKGDDAKNPIARGNNEENNKSGQAVLEMDEINTTNV